MTAELKAKHGFPTAGQGKVEREVRGWGVMSPLTQALFKGDLYLLEIAKCSFPTSSSQTCIFFCFCSSTPATSIRAEVLTGSRGPLLLGLLGNKVLRCFCADGLLF